MMRGAVLTALLLSLNAFAPVATAQPELQRTVVDGIELHVRSEGQGEPVVMIHGSLADYRYWLDSGPVEALASDHRVIVYSRRFNHPNTNPLIADHSAIVEARDLAGLLDAMGLRSVHLVGHSYGAYTALLFALAHPERVRSLVLAEPPLLPLLADGGAGFLERVWKPLAAAFAEGDDAALDFTARWYFQVPFADVEPAWQILFRANLPEWRALALSSDPFPLVDESRLIALRVPVLLLSGGNNAGGFNDVVDKRLHVLLPTARRVVIPGAGHEMFQDDPAASAAALRTFIRGAR